MVSRQETARALLTPGEVMQLPPDEALVQVSGVPPIRATKVRYYLDKALADRVTRPPNTLTPLSPGAPSDWPPLIVAAITREDGPSVAADEGGHRIAPEFEAQHETPPPAVGPETWLDPEIDADESPQAEQARRLRTAARAAALDPDDGIPL